MCTILVLPDDSLSLTIGGRDKKLSRRHWLEFAEYCAIPERATKRLISEQIEALEPALDLLARSFVSDDLKEQYERILREHTSVLAG